jgi:hypothetical protein
MRRNNMNEKDKMKNIKEINLIADYEMEWGREDNWPDHIVKEFNDKWEKIQRKYNNDEL